MGHKLKLFLILSVCLFVASAIVSGQSGRRQKRTEKQPPVQGVNQPEARVEPAPQAVPERPEKKEPDRSIMVASAMPDMMLPLFYADIAREACLKELRSALKSIDLRAGSNQTRSDAIKVAKDTGAYVVHMELQPDQFGGSRSNVDLRYTIFEPKTGKVAGSGSGYPSQPSGGLPLPPVGASQEQVYLEWMGRDVARQVMKRLNLVPII
jgi:hypothetical protein